jgi:hypothetical protein
MCDALAVWGSCFVGKEKKNVFECKIFENAARICLKGFILFLDTWCSKIPYKIYKWCGVVLEKQTIFYPSMIFLFWVKNNHSVFSHIYATTSYLRGANYLSCFVASCTK